MTHVIHRTVDVMCPCAVRHWTANIRSAITVKFRFRVFFYCQIRWWKVQSVLAATPDKITYLFLNCYLRDPLMEILETFRCYWEPKTLDCHFPFLGGYAGWKTSNYQLKHVIDNNDNNNSNNRRLVPLWTPF